MRYSLAITDMVGGEMWHDLGLSAINDRKPDSASGSLFFGVERRQMKLVSKSPLKGDVSRVWCDRHGVLLKDDEVGLADLYVGEVVACVGEIDDVDGNVIDVEGRLRGGCGGGGGGLGERKSNVAILLPVAYLSLDVLLALVSPSRSVAVSPSRRKGMRRGEIADTA